MIDNKIIENIRDNRAKHVDPGLPSLPLPTPSVKTDLIENFIDELKNNHAKVNQCARQTLAIFVNDFIIKSSLTESALISIAAKKYINSALSFPYSSRRAQYYHRFAISLAYCGIAETGTCVMCSDEYAPTSHNFLVKSHLVLMPSSRIVEKIEDVWELMRSEDKTSPRAINFISGPSRTADIEQTMHIGAHGPSRYQVFIIRD